MKEILQQPKLGTKTAIVVEHLKMGESHPQIVEATGFDKGNVSCIIYQAYKRKYVPIPSEEERSRRWKESHSEVSRALTGRRRPLEYRRKASERRGGEWLAIEKYAKLGMSVPEIEIAVLLELGRVLEPVQICNAHEHAKQRGELPRPTPSEKRKILQDRVRPKEEIELNVRQMLNEWNNVQELITKGKLEKAPKDIDDWVLLTRFFHARCEKMRDNEEPLRLFTERLDDIPEETLLRLKPCFEVISGATSVIKNNGSNGSNGNGSFARVASFRQDFGVDLWES